MSSAAAGSTSCGEETIEWNAGDILVLPGGVPHDHEAAGEDAILWIVSNEPQLAFENLRAPRQARHRPRSCIIVPMKSPARST